MSTQTTRERFATSPQTRPRTSTTGQPSNSRRRLSLWWIPRHGVVITISLVWLVPIAAMVLSSFRTGAAAALTGWWQILDDAGITGSNYGQALNGTGIIQGLVNSLLVSVPSSALLVALASVTSYVFVVTEFRGKSLLFLLIISLLVMPPQMVIEPMLQLFTSIGLNGQYASMWLFQLGFSLPLSILILRSAYADVPSALLESAQVDGASCARTFLSIATPSVLPGLASVFVLNLITTWNELLGPIIFLNNSTATVTVQIAGLVNSADRDNTTLIAAEALISIIPPLLVFVFLQRYFVRGFMSGAVK